MGDDERARFAGVEAACQGAFLCGGGADVIYPADEGGLLVAAVVGCGWDDFVEAGAELLYGVAQHGIGFGLADLVALLDGAAVELGVAPADSPDARWAGISN